MVVDFPVAKDTKKPVNKTAEIRANFFEMSMFPKSLCLILEDSENNLVRQVLRTSLSMQMYNAKNRCMQWFFVR